jgi:hypothetical protein
MISISGAVTIIVYLIIGGVIFALLRWLINSSPIDPKFKEIANWVLIVLAVLVLIGVLLNFAGIGGGGPIFRP